MVVHISQQLSISLVQANQSYSVWCHLVLSERLGQVARTYSLHILLESHYSCIWCSRCCSCKQRTVRLTNLQRCWKQRRLTIRRCRREVSWNLVVFCSQLVCNPAQCITQQCVIQQCVTQHSVVLCGVFDVVDVVDVFDVCT